MLSNLSITTESFQGMEYFELARKYLGMLINHTAWYYFSSSYIYTCINEPRYKLIILAASIIPLSWGPTLFNEQYQCLEQILNIDRFISKNKLEQLTFTFRCGRSQEHGFPNVCPILPRLLRRASHRWVRRRPTRQTVMNIICHILPVFVRWPNNSQNDSFPTRPRPEPTHTNKPNGQMTRNCFVFEKQILIYYNFRIEYLMWKKCYI